MEGFCEHNGVFAIEARWLMDNMLSESSYKQLSARKSITVIRRSAPGYPALVHYASLPQRFKDKIVTLLGKDPRELLIQKSRLHQLIESYINEGQAMAAHKYYHCDYKHSDGKHLTSEKAKEYYHNAVILESIYVYLQEKKAFAITSRRRLNIHNEFNDIVIKVTTEIASAYFNSLPANGDRLRKKYNEYHKEGYDSLIHKMHGKSSNHKGKLSEEEQMVIKAIVALGKKQNDVQSTEIASELGINIDRRRVQEIRKENELEITAKREGASKFINELMMQHKRERPTQPLKFITLDGWDAELYYQNDKSYFNRLNIVVVLDTLNNYPLGWAIGDSETNALNIEALKNAVYHTKELFGDYYGFWQIQSDNFGYAELPQYYQSICQYYTPTSRDKNKKSAKSKVVEPYFRYLQNKHIWKFNNYSGHGITAKNQPNTDRLNEQKFYFPDKETCIKQLTTVMELERQIKVGAIMEAWDKTATEMKLPFDHERYLMQFGSETKGNMLTPHGLIVQRNNEKYIFDIFSIEMRKHRGEQWILKYDLNDMSRALAVSKKDGTLRYLMTAKQSVPMAIADYTEADWALKKKVDDFNEELREHVANDLAETQRIAEGYVNKLQLESEFARMLVDKNGQHKINKATKRKELAAKTQSNEEVLIPTAIIQKSKRKSIEQSVANLL